MCGIFGVYNFNNKPVDPSVIDRMSSRLQHRGPDADGVFQSDRAALGNRRLSIIDTTAASNQPLFSEDGQVVLVQNGEIYNYVELREELIRLGANFATTGDTEVLLRAYEIWGKSFVTRLNGMFAIAVLDRTDSRLLLYRDRLGVKPLYFAGDLQEGRIWFASEIKSILCNGNSYPPNTTAIAKYLALNYIPLPDTAFSGITHLEPGHWAEFTPDGVEINCFWDLNAVRPQPAMSEADCQAAILRLLDDATRIRMRSDAPFGAFLSGGLDSSSVVGFMSQHTARPLHTFSIGFDDPRFDETEYARMAARRFGTLHVSNNADHDVTAMWPRFIWHCDQPHGDVSFMPMDMVSNLASREVKMVQTGDGGDELFAGYEKYLSVFPGGKTDHLKDGWQEQAVRNTGLLLDDQPARLLVGALRDAFFDTDPYRSLSDKIRGASGQDPINQLLLAETTSLLPGNNLVKPDRMAMANSLEVRSPYLDFRMVELAFAIPGHLKLAGGETKAILKKAVQPLLGDTLTYRKKQMFTVPVGEWFRQALAGYCREVLLDGRLEARGLFDIAAVSDMIEAHIAGTQNFTRQLRALISLEIWYRLFVDEDPDWITKAGHGLSQ
ncbi:MAG: asparagine synthase (glutamine-hydrolyzing) [Rhodobacteraceae bacterium]|nr:asparagine synthase (glutamine-hydrolyzing) [Paracoccaceae bacterium]